MRTIIGLPVYFEHVDIRHHGYPFVRVKSRAGVIVLAVLTLLPYHIK